MLTSVASHSRGTIGEAVERIMQNFSDTLGQVFRAIVANKLRSFLTMFGIAWGVGSLLVLVGLGEGFRSGPASTTWPRWATTW